MKGSHGKKSSSKNKYLMNQEKKVIDISADVESAVGTKLSNTGLCFAFAEVKIKVFHFRLCRRWHLWFLNGAFSKEFRVVRNLKSLTEILYRFINVSFHSLSGFKVNIADSRVFHLVCETGKYHKDLICVQEILPLTFVQASK